MIEPMPLDGEYEPNTMQWVRDQVNEYESSGGTKGTTLRGMPVVVMTSRGNRSGKLRKTPVMRVEHDGRYAAVASLGGAPKNPVWYHNLIADPHVELQDGTVRMDMVARETTGDERAEWWSAPWPLTPTTPSTSSGPPGSSRSSCSNPPSADRPARGHASLGGSSGVVIVKSVVSAWTCSIVGEPTGVCTIQRCPKGSSNVNDRAP